MSDMLDKIDTIVFGEFCVLGGEIGGFVCVYDCMCVDLCMFLYVSVCILYWASGHPRGKLILWSNQEKWNEKLSKKCVSTILLSYMERK